MSLERKRGDVRMEKIREGWRGDEVRGPFKDVRNRFKQRCDPAAGDEDD